MTAEGWAEINKAIGIITEHFENMALFINWVDDEGETQHCEILDGNTFALENHIDKWLDGDFLVDESQEADDDDDGHQNTKA